MRQSPPTSSSHLGVVIVPTAAERFAIQELSLPDPAPNEAVIRVKAFSLNGGEVRRALTTQEKGFRPGVDIAGVIERAAADGSGPPVGTRVAALSRKTQGWAQIAHQPTDMIAPIPDAVSFDCAACLPVAGLTAMLALEKGGQLLGNKVLITGASGALGRFACQMAVRSGAYVVASIRRPDAEAKLKADGVHEVIVSADPAEAGKHGPYHLILETQGGKSLASSLVSTGKGGTVVLCGNASNEESTFEARDFYTQGRVKLIGLYLTPELELHKPSALLSRLLRLVEMGIVTPPIEASGPWTDIGDFARRYGNRQLNGKVVMRVE